MLTKLMSPLVILCVAILPLALPLAALASSNRADASSSLLKFHGNSRGKTYREARGKTSHYATVTTPSVASPVSLVDPMIGTGGLGYGVGSIVPGATLPFGMVKLSPDSTQNGLAPGFSHCAGYWYHDPQIRGFSHNHLAGTGLSDQGNIRVMPMIGISDRQSTEAGYWSSFSHDSEVARPGYYAVTLDNGDIRAELTATAHTGVHRYRFPENSIPTILLDVSAVIGENYASDVIFEIWPDANEIVGSMNNHGSLSGRYGGQIIYFSARFDLKFDLYGVFSDGLVFAGETTIEGGTQMGAYVQYTGDTTDTYTLAVGISYVSIEQARLNRETETSGLDFDAIAERASTQWTNALNVIAIDGGNSTDQTIFYTALYHSMMMPTLYTDVNGYYRGLDQNVHEVDGFTYYTDMSLWDTFRTLHPLITLIEPARQRDFIESLLRMNEQLGYFDRWPQGNGPTGCMIGDCAAMVISESVQKGIDDFDTDSAFEALRNMGTPDSNGWKRDGLDAYLDYGYLPMESGGSSTSKTLEYAYNDAALAYYADRLGLEDEVAIFADRALSYRNLWDPASHFLQGRSEDGTYDANFHPYFFADYYTEGNAYHWTWYAPHDMEGLIDLFGGSTAFETRLDSYFDRSERAPNTLLPDMNYWHGNEPDLHAAWQYHYIGKPEKSADAVDWIRTTRYAASPEGLDGNDDGGTLSAWYVLTALGLFPIAGTDVYLIGSPLFQQTTIRRDAGDITLRCLDFSEANRYVVALKLNGETLSRAWIRHHEIAAGAELEFQMAGKSNGWGSLDLPPSLSTEMLAEITTR